MKLLNNQKPDESGLMMESRSNPNKLNSDSNFTSPFVIASKEQQSELPSVAFETKTEWQQAIDNYDFDKEILAEDEQQTNLDKPYEATLTDFSLENERKDVWLSEKLEGIFKLFDVEWDSHLITPPKNESEKIKSNSIEKSGVYFCKILVVDKHKYFKIKRVCESIRITKRYRTEKPLIGGKSFNEFGSVLEWKDPVGKAHILYISDEVFSSNATKLRAQLLKEGLNIEIKDSGEKDYFLHYLQTAKNDKRLDTVILVDKHGWHEINGKWYYATANKIYAPKSENEVVFNNTYIDSSWESPSCDLRLWQDNVAIPAKNLPIWIFSIVMPFLSVLLRPLSIDSFAIQIGGSSSKGKTTGVQCAQSVGGNPHGMYEFKGTDTHKEVTCLARNDFFAVFDEITKALPKEIEGQFYMMANGIGKGRSDKGLRAKLPNTWKTLVLTTGEKTLLQIYSRYGKERPPAGLLNRLIYIPNNETDFTPTNGMTCKKFVDTLKKATGIFYGSPMETFLSSLIAWMEREGAENVFKFLTAKIDGYMQLVTKGMEYDSQVQRRLLSFAGAHVIGELISGGYNNPLGVNITGWNCTQKDVVLTRDNILQEGGDSAKAVYKCLKWHLEHTEAGNLQFEDQEAIDHINSLIDMKIANWIDCTDVDVKTALKYQKPHDLYGLIRIDKGKVQYVIKPQIFKEVFCLDRTPQRLKKLLKSKKWIVGSEKDYLGGFNDRCSRLVTLIRPKDETQEENSD